MAFQPTDDECRAALEHIRYEIQQLAMLYHVRTVPLGPFLGNAIIETTVIHLNILIAFFETTLDKRIKDDVLAVDFGFSASLLRVDHEIVDRRNKEVAHLTYKRTERAPDERGWDFQQLLPPVLERSAAFVSHMLGSSLMEEDVERERWRELGRHVEGFRSLKLTVAASSSTTASIGHSIGFGDGDPETETERG